MAVCCRTRSVCIAAATCSDPRPSLSSSLSHIHPVLNRSSSPSYIHSCCSSFYSLGLSGLACDFASTYISFRRHLFVPLFSSSVARGGSVCASAATSPALSLLFEPLLLVTPTFPRNIVVYCPSCFKYVPQKPSCRGCCRHHFILHIGFREPQYGQSSHYHFCSVL